MKSCKLDSCNTQFEPRNSQHLFHDPKCKAEYHRTKPFEKGVRCTVIESKTGKGGVDTIIRTSLDDRAKMADLALPSRKGWFIPDNELF